MRPGGKVKIPPAAGPASTVTARGPPEQPSLFDVTVALGAALRPLRAADDPAAVDDPGAIEADPSIDGRAVDEHAGTPGHAEGVSQLADGVVLPAGSTQTRRASGPLTVSGGGGSGR